MAVVFTFTGETVERFRGMVYRGEKPKQFWSNVVWFYLAGLFFIGLFLYKNSN